MWGKNTTFSKLKIEFITKGIGKIQSISNFVSHKYDLKDSKKVSLETNLLSKYIFEVKYS